MKSIKTFVAVAALSMISFGTFAPEHQRQRFHPWTAQKPKLPRRPQSKARLTKSPALNSITAYI